MSYLWDIDIFRFLCMKKVPFSLYLFIYLRIWIFYSFIQGLSTVQWFSFIQNQVSPHVHVCSIPFCPSIVSRIPSYSIRPSIWLWGFSSFMFPLVPIPGLSLHSVALCEWVHMRTVFVIIKYSCRHLKYNKMPKPCLKHTGSVAKKLIC
jgi:hypothetical protein